MYLCVARFRKSIDSVRKNHRFQVKEYSTFRISARWNPKIEMKTIILRWSPFNGRALRTLNGVSKGKLLKNQSPNSNTSNKASNKIRQSWDKHYIVLSASSRKEDFIPICSVYEHYKDVCPNPSEENRFHEISGDLHIHKVDSYG